MIPVPELAVITLIDPFLPEPEVGTGVLAELEDFFGSLVPFSFTLGEPTRFPNGATYLPLEPMAPFRRIVAGLRNAFPEAAREPGLGSVTPPLLPWPEEYDETRAIPTRAVARAARLLAGAELETEVATFAFGISAA